MSEVETSANAEGTAVPTENVSAEIETQDQPQGVEADSPAEPLAEGEQPPSGDEKAENERKEAKRNSFQERISEKTRQAKEAETRAKDAEERAALLESQIKELTGEETRFPQLEDFDYDQSKYQEAVIAYNSQQMQRTVQQGLTEQQRAAARLAAEEAGRAAAEAFQARSAAFAEDHPDFQDKVTSPKFVQSQAVHQAIVLAENGPALAYHLASNPEITARLNASDPASALMELGRISAQLATPPPVKTTTTPKPVSPVTPNGQFNKDPDKMSPAEYAAMRRAQKAG